MKKKIATRPLSGFDELDAAGIGAGYRAFEEEQPVAEAPKEKSTSLGDYSNAAGSGVLKGIAGTATGIGTFAQAPAANTLSGVLGARALVDRGVTGVRNWINPGSSALDEDVQSNARMASQFAAEERAKNSADGGIAGAAKSVEGFGRASTQALKDFDENYNPELIKQEKNVSDAKGFWGTAKATLSNPLALTGSLAQSAPDMALGVGVGSLAARSRMALGLGAVEKAGAAAAKTVAASGGDLVAQGVAANAARDAAAQALQKSATHVAGSVGVVSESASSAYGGREGTYQQVMGMPEQTLLKTPRYNAILAATGDPAKARMQFANEIADQAPMLTALGTALGSMAITKITGHDLTAELAAGAKKTTAKDIAVNALGHEGPEEVLQGIPEDLVQHGAMVQADPDHELDLGGGIAQNYIAGAVMGAGGTGASYVKDKFGKQAPVDPAAAAAKLLADQQEAARKAAVGAAHAAALTPNSPISRAAAAANPQADPAKRLAELKSISNGTADQVVTGFDGKKIVIPGRHGRFFTAAEKEEYDTLKAAGGAQKVQSAVGQQLTPEEAWAKAQELDAKAALDEANGVDAGGSVADGMGVVPAVNAPAPNMGLPTAEQIEADQLANPDAYGPSLQQPAFDAQAAQAQYRADTLAAQQAQDDELNAQAEAALATMAQNKQQTRPANEVVSDGGYLYEGTQNGDVLNGMGKPFTLKLGALQEAKRQERENGGEWTIAQVFDGFVARKKAQNQPLATVELAQEATETIAPSDVERYQWQRNAEGGQERGNQQTIQPLTEALFNEYIAPKVAVKSYRDYQQQFPAATHISLVQKADGSVELGAGGVGPIDKLRPSAAPVEKGWVKAVDSFDSPEAVAHGSSADSASQTKSLAGEPIDKEWTAFHPESGTLNVPRADMPQIKSENRGALVNFLKARGIDSTHEEVPTESLKPTQTEYSPEKVEKAKGYKDGDRSILVSSDGHVLDGHHQWVAKHEAGEPVKVIRLDAPIDALLSAVREFPSAETAVNSTTQESSNEKAPETQQESAKPEATASAEPVNTPESGEPAADPAGASPSEVDLTTVEGVARAVQLKVAANRRKSREKSREEREAKGYAPNSTPESEKVDYEAEISAQPSDMQKKSAAAMLGTDPLPLIGMFVNGNFEASEDVFKAITGVKIRGLSAAAKKAALYQWAGWTPEQIAQAEGDVQARKDEAAEKYRQDDLKSAVTGAWLGLDRLKVNLKSGDTITGQDFVLQSVAGGFDKAHSQKKGAAVIYGLTDGSRFTTLKAREFTAFVKSAIAFGGLDKALAYVNPPKPQAPEGFVDRSIDIGGVKDDGMTAKAFSKPDAQSPVEDAAPAPQVDPPSAEPAPRPKNWENNYGAASKIAEGLNIALRGANGKMKKVPELVAEIKALDVHNSGMEKLAADWAAQDASKNPEKVDTSAEPVQKPDESEQATPNPVSERKSRIASALDNGGHVVGSELRDRNGLRLLILTPEELADMPGDKIRTKPDANMARTQSSASEQVDAAQAEWTRTRDVDRMGIALKAGFKESVAESLSKRAWSSLDVVVQEKLAEAMAETQPTAPTGEDALYTSTAKLTQPQTLDDFIGNVDAGYRAHFEYAGADGRTLWIEKVEGGWVLKSKDDDSTMTSTKGGAGAGGRWSKAQALREAENDAKFRYTEWKPLVPKAEGMFQTPAEKAEIENKQAPTQDMINEALRLEVLNPGRMTATDLAKAIDAAKQRQKEEHARISAQIEAKKKGEATSETAEPKAFTQEDVKAAERQALGVIEAAIDQMKWESAQRFAAKFLPSMGVPVVTGKAKLKAAMADPKINLLAAASDLGVEFAHSVRAALLAKFEGRIATADATPSQVMLNQLLNVDSRLLLNDLDAATHDVDIGFLKALHDKLRDLDIGASHDRKLRKQDRIGYVLQAIQAKETGKGGIGSKKAAPSSDPAERVSTTHAGLKIYPVRVNIGGDPADRWGVQTLNNAEREKNGERQIGGDPLAETLEQAKELAEQEVATAKTLEKHREELQRVEQEKSNKDAAEKTAFDEPPVGRFIAASDYTPMRKGAATLALKKLIGFNGASVETHQFIESLVADGYAPTLETENRIADKSRREWNRMDDRQQREHERKVKNGGTVEMAYMVNGDSQYSIGKTEYAYAKFLHGSESIATGAPTIEEVKAEKPKDDDRAWEQAGMDGVMHTRNSGPVFEWKYANYWMGGKEQDFPGTYVLPESKFYNKTIANALPKDVLAFIQDKVRERMAWYEKEFGVIASKDDALAPASTKPEPSKLIQAMNFLMELEAEQETPSQTPSNTIKSSPSEDAAIEAKTTIEQLDAQIKRHEELLGCLG